MAIDQKKVRALIRENAEPRNADEAQWLAAQKQLIRHFVNCEICMLALQISSSTFPPCSLGVSRLRRLMKTLFSIETDRLATTSFTKYLIDHMPTRWVSTLEEVRRLMEVHR